MSDGNPAQLPDLSVTPKEEVKETRVDVAAEDDLMEAAMPEGDAERLLEDALSRVGKYQERLEKDMPKQGEPETLDKTHQPTKDVLKIPAKIGAKREGLNNRKQQGGTRTNVAKSAALSLAARKKDAAAVQTAKETTAAKKPAVPVFAKKKEDASPTTPTQDNQGREDPGETVLTSPDALFPPSQGLGDEGFPSPGIPGPSSEYKELSIISTGYENIQGDLETLGNQVKSLMAHIKDQNTRLGTVETFIQEIRTDKSQFQSALLDKMRALERQMGNRPSIATVSSAIVPPETIAAAPGHNPAKAPVDIREKLRALRVKNTQ